MPTINAGQSQDFFLSATDGLFVTCTGVAKISYENEILASAGSVSAADGEVRIGYFGVPMGLTISALSGTCTVNTSPSVIEPLTARQAGDNNDSSALDIKLAVNSLALYPAKQSQSVVLFGDSYAEAQNYPNAPFSGDTLSISLWRFVLSRLGASVNVVRNAGISGNTAQNMLDRYSTDVSPYKSDWVFFDAGINDFYGFSYTAEEVFADVKQLLSLMINDGRKVLMINCPPQLSSRVNFSAAKSTQSALYNKLIADYVETINGVILVDVYSPFVDQMDTTNGGSIAKYLASDGVHLSTFGTIAAADVIVPQISRVISNNPLMALAPLDLGVLGTRAVLAGTGGSNGTGSSGVVATGYTVQRASGTNGTIVNSKLVNGQRSVVTLIATNGISNIRVGINLLTQWQAVAGSTLSTVIKYRVRTESGAVHVRGLVLQLMVNDGATMTYATDGTIFGGNPAATDETFDTGACLSKLKPFVIPATVTNGSFAIDLTVDSIAGGVFSIELYGIDCRVRP